MYLVPSPLPSVAHVRGFRAACLSCRSRCVGETVCLGFLGLVPFISLRSHWWRCRIAWGLPGRLAGAELCGLLPALLLSPFPSPPAACMAHGQPESSSGHFTSRLRVAPSPAGSGWGWHKVPGAGWLVGLVRDKSGGLCLSLDTRDVQMWGSPVLALVEDRSACAASLPEPGSAPSLAARGQSPLSLGCQNLSQVEGPAFPNAAVVWPKPL